MFASVLVIGKELTQTDVDFVTSVRGDDPTSFVVLMAFPGDWDCLLRTVVDDVTPARKPVDAQARRSAEHSLSTSLSRLRGAGSKAEGKLVDAQPLDELRSVVDHTRAEEVLVLAPANRVEEFLEREWASLARVKVGVPVLKLFTQD